ncbi:MAG: right-handed parallel beta-helix repeat-containing protein, partial [Euryarchaeota archaeon]|nr:right-handed parallel beta-helix repeat-containing protein [Euryarchaeota archaeon]
SVNDAMNSVYKATDLVKQFYKAGKITLTNATDIWNDAEIILERIVDLGRLYLGKPLGDDIANVEKYIYMVMIEAMMKIPDNTNWMQVEPHLTVALARFQKAMEKLADGKDTSEAIQTGYDELISAKDQLAFLVSDGKIPQEFGDWAIGMIDNALLIFASDLAIASENVSLNHLASVGKKAEMSIVVKNAGRTDVDQATVEAYDETEHMLLATKQIYELDAGAQTTLKVDWKPLTSGTHYIRVAADPSNDVFETNEDNNAVTKGFFVTSGTTYVGPVYVPTGQLVRWDSTNSTITDKTIVVSGDITIDGTLRVGDGYTVIMNCTFDNQYMILVNPSGELNSNVGHFASPSSGLTYSFIVGGRLTLISSTVQWVYGEISNVIDVAGGIQLYSNYIDIEYSEIFEGKSHGIFILPDVVPNIISHNTIRNNGKYGILYLDRANGTIDNNNISGNPYGVYCYKASPTITNNANISWNSNAGIYCYQASPTITSNKFIGNYYGIYSYLDSTSNISGNTALGNTEAGVWCQSQTVSGSPTIQNNPLISGSPYGVHAYSSSPLVKGNGLSGNSKGVVGQFSSANVSGNTISANTWGVRGYRTTSAFMVYGNVIEDNDGDGVFISGASSSSSGSSKITGNNSIFGNKGNGVHLYAYSTNSKITNNSICTNRGDGVRLYTYSTNNMIMNNSLSANNGTGISLSSGDYWLGDSWDPITTLNSSTANTIANNTISSDYYDCISLYETYNNTIVNNTLFSNGRAAIHLLGSSNNTIENNTISGQGEYSYRTFSTDGLYGHYFSPFMPYSTSTFCRPEAVYNSVSDCTYMIYMNWSFCTYIVEYNHVTETFSEPVPIGVTCYNDHCMPVLSIDSDGYLYVFYGQRYGYWQYYQISTSPYNISSWSGPIAFDSGISSYFSYPQVWNNPGTNRLIYMAQDYSGPTLFMTTYDRLNDTWSGRKDIIDYHISTPYLISTMDPLHNNTIHLAWTYYAGGTTRVYYMRGVDGGDRWYNASWSYMGTDNISDSNPDELSFDSGSSVGTNCWVITGDVNVNSTGNPMIVFSRETSDSGVAIRSLMFAQWNNGSFNWDISKITDCGNENNQMCLIVDNDTHFRAYCAIGPDFGGPLKEFISSDSGGTWTYNRTVAGGVTSLPARVYNAKSDKSLEFTFGGGSFAGNVNAWGQNIPQGTSQKSTRPAGIVVDTSDLKEGTNDNVQYHQQRPSNYNSIRNNTISNTSHGIALYRSAIGNNIANNIVSNNGIGIGVYYTGSNTITNNRIGSDYHSIVNETVPSSGTTTGPLYLANGNVLNCTLYVHNGSVNWAKLEEWTHYVLNYDTGEIDISPIAPIDSSWEFYAYYNYTIEGGNRYGIYAVNSSLAAYNNAIIGNDEDGVFIDSQGNFALNPTIDGNKIIGNRNGVRFLNGTFTATYNEILLNKGTGVYIENGKGEVAWNSIIGNNPPRAHPPPEWEFTGIDARNCDDVWIHHNNVSSNGANVYLYLSTNINIEWNTIVDASAVPTIYPPPPAPIGIYSVSSQMTASNNTIWGTCFGMEIRNADASTIIRDNNFYPLEGTPNEPLPSRGVYLNSASVIVEWNTFNWIGTGIYCEQNSNANISNNTIMNSSEGVHSLGSSPTIKRNNITNNGDGIYAENSINIKIQYNNITENIDGIILSNVGGASTYIDHNNIGNNGYGIRCKDYSVLYIAQNNITSNSYGIYSGTYSNPLITSNNIVGNTAFGAYNADLTTPSLTAISNWWGASSGPYNPITYPTGTGDWVSEGVNGDLPLSSWVVWW